MSTQASSRNKTLKRVSEAPQRALLIMLLHRKRQTSLESHSAADSQILEGRPLSKPSSTPVVNSRWSAPAVQSTGENQRLISAPLGDIWQRLETLLVVTTEREGAIGIEQIEARDASKPTMHKRGPHDQK